MPFDPGQFALVSGRDVAAETAVLLHHLARRLGDTPPPPPPAADPQLLFEIARLNKVALFLPRDPQELPEGCAPLRGWLDAMRLKTMTMNRRSLKAGAEVAGLLAAAGIAHVQFKGPLQQLALYGDANAKPVGDVDLLVAEADGPRVRGLLEAAGFRAQGGRLAGWWWRSLGELHFAREALGPVVDLHHRVQQPGSPDPRRIGAFLDNAVPMDFEGKVIPVLSASDRCLLAAISVVKALFGREPCAGYLMDLRASLALLSPDEAEALPRLAAEQGLTETLGFASHAVDAVFAGLSARSFAIGGNPLPLPADKLRRMLVTPSDAGIDWPRRRSVLWALCGRAPLRYARETARAARSEAYRRSLGLALSRQATTAEGSRP